MNKEKYTVVYVLTDDINKRVFNEFMISVSSLRYSKYNGVVMLITDTETEKILKTEEKELQKLNINLKVVDINDRLTKMEKSRYIKTSLREYISGDFLYVDTDTLFANKLPNVISENELALVGDRNISKLKKGTISYAYCMPIYKKLGINYIEGKSYFNSGIIWAKDTDKVHDFYKKWHKTWKDFKEKGIPFDQQALNFVDWETRLISTLDDSFNFQMPTNGIMPYDILSKSYIIHYLHPEKEGSYLMTSKKYRELSYKSDEIIDVIKSPKTSFNNCYLINKDSYDAKLINSKAYKLLSKIYKYKTTYNIVESILNFLSRIFKRKQQ